MRCPSDLSFASLCDRVGKNQITSDDVQFFESRVVTDEIPEEMDNENFKTGKCQNCILRLGLGIVLKRTSHFLKVQDFGLQFVSRTPNYR